GKAWMKMLNESYGDLFELYIGNNRVINICKAEYMEKLFISSSKNNKFPHRFGHSEGLKELGDNDVGLIGNANLECWKSSRLFFNSMLLPSFCERACDAVNRLWKEMESNWSSYYNDSKNEFEIDMTEWIRKFTASMTFELNLGIKTSLIQENKNLISMLDMYLTSLEWFLIHPYWMRHYIPFMRAHTKRLLKNRDDLFDIISKIINERRKEIENSLINKDGKAEQMNDMLSMMIISNTSLIVDNSADDLSPGRKFGSIMVKGMMTMLYRKYDVELVCEEDIKYYRDYLLAYYQNFVTKLKPRNDQNS
ncbi:3518_t:CDS:2, partial [Dentiscutata heterogama]